MRTPIALLAISIAFVACDDRQEPTSPRTDVTVPRAATTAAVATPSSQTVVATAANSQATKAPGAKPTDQVGFTKLNYYEIGPMTVNAGNSGEMTLVCPTGSYVMSGGHRLQVTGGTSPVLAASGALMNGWHVKIDNNLPGATAVTYQISVNCIS